MIPRVFIALLAITAGPAEAWGSQGAALERALVRGDHHEIERIGATMSAAELAPALSGSAPRFRRLAAAYAAPHAEDSWVLLVALAAQAQGPDRPFASVAARSAARIAAALDRDRVTERDIPDDALRMRLILWQAIGDSPGRWPDVRVHAMTVAQRLREAIPGGARDVPAYDPNKRFADPEPEVRRAALELIPPLQVPRHATGIAKLVVADRNPVVALVAAQTLCGTLAHGRDPATVLGELSPAGLVRVRTLVDTPKRLPPAALLDAARCLAVDADPASKSALTKLRKRAPRSIRRLLRRLGRR